MTITLRDEGKRIYFAGNTFPAKDQIKALGGRWDADAKAWWVGAARRAEAVALIVEIGAEQNRAADALVAAAATYFAAATHAERKARAAASVAEHGLADYDAAPSVAQQAEDAAREAREAADALVAAAANYAARAARATALAAEAADARKASEAADALVAARAAAARAAADAN